MTESNLRDLKENWFGQALAHPALPVAIVGVIGSIIGVFAPVLAKVIELKMLNNDGAKIASLEDLPRAKLQHELWQRNMSCLGQPQTWLEADQLKLAAIVCPNTGDILVQYSLDKNKKQLFAHWIPKEEQPSQTALIPNPFPPAYAEPTIHLARKHDKNQDSPTQLLVSQEFKAIFQRQTSPTRVVRITQKNGGGCNRELINSYSGQVTREAIGQCSLGYCTLLPSGQSERSIINDRCAIGRNGANQIDLTWSNGLIMKIQLRPATLDGKPARLIHAEPAGATIKSTRGNVGFCWDCKP
jgi:hypothetical protein